MAAGLDSQKIIRLFREAVADSPKAMSPRHSQVGTGEPTSKPEAMTGQSEFLAVEVKRSFAQDFAS
jgi:hypothetical protein